MQTAKYLAKILNVHRQDIGAVFPMLLLAFFSGLGIATAFTAINVSLIDQHGVHMLPIILMISGITLLGTGYFYTLLEQKLGPSKLYNLVIFISIVWALFSYMLLSDQRLSERYIITYVSYYTIYLLYNLQFWAVAALRFSSRQSKTIFGLLTSGESLAKIIGYGITPFIVISYDINALLVVSAFCFFLSWPVWLFAARKIQFKAIDHELHENSVHHHPITQMISSLKEVTFFKYVSAFALLSVLIYHLIHYAFLTQVEAEFNELTDLAIFFSAIYGVGKFLNFSIKGLLTSRLLKRLGIYRVLLILPLLFLVIHTIGFFGSFDNPNNSHVLLWVFSISVLLDEIIRSSIVKPTFLVLFQPLAKNLRLIGHSLAKGIMEPMGMFLAGVISFVLINRLTVSLAWLNLLLIFLIGLWILFILKTKGGHLETIIRAIQKRVLHSDKTQNLDPSIKIKLLERLNSSQSILEILYTIKILNHIPNEDISTKIKNIIDQVELTATEKIAFIDHISKYPDMRYFNTITSWINEDDRIIRNRATDVLFLLNSEKAEEFMPILDPPHDLNEVHLGHSLKHGGLYTAIKHGPKLMSLLSSTESEKILKGLQALQHTHNKEFYQPIIPLLNHTNHQVRKNAIKLCGTIRSEQLIPHLFSQLNTEYAIYAKQALSQYSHASAHYLINNADKTEDKNIIYKILRNIGDPTTVTWLVSELQQSHFNQQKSIAKALADSTGSGISERNKQKLIAYIKESLAVLDVLGIINDAPILWRKAVASERRSRMDTINILLKSVYPHPAIIDALDHLRWGNQDQKSTSIEHLESIASHSFNRALVHTFDRHYLYGDIPKGNKYENLIIDILNSMDERIYSPWLIACALRLFPDVSVSVTNGHQYSKIINQELKLRAYG